MRRVLVVAIAALSAACSSASKPQQAPASSVQASMGAPASISVGMTRIEVQLSKVTDPATPGAGQPAPTTGMRYVAVELLFIDDGPGAYADAPMSGLHGYDGTGESLNIQVGAITSAGAPLDVISGVHLDQGDTQSGWVVFLVPVGQRLTRVLYAPANATQVEWRL